MTETIRTSTQIREALERELPRDLSAPITQDRRYLAERAIVYEAGVTLLGVLNWNPLSLRTTNVPEKQPPKPSQQGRARAELAPVQASSGEFSIRLDARHRMIEFGAASTFSCHPLEHLFLRVLRAGVSAALSAIASIAKTRSGVDDTDVGFEMVSRSIRPWTEVQFLRRLFDAELAPFQYFMLGHIPFRNAYAPSVAIMEWLLGLPGTTFEGDLLRTGLILEDSSAGVESPRSASAQFDSPQSFEQVARSRQRLVCADGQRSFLHVDVSSMLSRGLVFRTTDLDSLIVSAPPSAPVSMPLSRVWVQARDHQRLSLVGESSDAEAVHIAEVRRSGLWLVTPYSQLRAIADEIKKLVSADIETCFRFTKWLWERCRTGAGGCVIIGEEPESDRENRIVGARPFAGFEPEWSSLMVPDGAVVLDNDLRPIAWGVFVRSGGSQASEHSDGTRHLAMKNATRDRKNLAIALSADGAISVFRCGLRVLRMD